MESLEECRIDFISGDFEEQLKGIGGVQLVTPAMMAITVEDRD